MPRILRRSAADPHGDKARWRTPRALFDALDQEFGFQVDLAADCENHLCDHWFGPGGAAEDALAVEWGASPGFCNPPYDSNSLGLFATKGGIEAVRGFTSVWLVPLAPDTTWWELLTRGEYQIAKEIRTIPHRVPYLRADGVTKAGAMFPSSVVILRPWTNRLGPVNWTEWDYGDRSSARRRRLTQMDRWWGEVERRGNDHT